MALQRTILVPKELWENRSYIQPPVKKILKSEDHNYNKFTQVPLQEDPLLET
jgi:hypothetical protein